MRLGRGVQRDLSVETMTVPASGSCAGRWSGPRPKGRGGDGSRIMRGGRRGRGGCGALNCSATPVATVVGHPPHAAGGRAARPSRASRRGDVHAVRDRRTRPWALSMRRERSRRCPRVWQESNGRSSTGLRAMLGDPTGPGPGGTIVKRTSLTYRTSAGTTFSRQSRSMSISGPAPGSSRMLSRSTPGKTR